jgi:hypothetical protein
VEQTNGGTTSIQFGREWIKREDGIGSIMVFAFGCFMIQVIQMASH